MGGGFLEISVVLLEIEGKLPGSLAFGVLESFPWRCVSSSGGGEDASYILGFLGEALSRPLLFLPI